VGMQTLEAAISANQNAQNVYFIRIRIEFEHCQPFSALSSKCLQMPPVLLHSASKSAFQSSKTVRAKQISTVLYKQTR
jgi:hypothetical protein